MVVLRRRTGVVLVVMMVVTAGLVGCSRQPTEAALPPGLVCEALDSSKLAPLLPPGAYQTIGRIGYLKGAVATGVCELHLTSGDDPVFQVEIATEMGYPQAIDQLYGDCTDPFPIELTLPPVGELVGSGSCRRPNDRLEHTNMVWAQYWGGSIAALDVQSTTLIEVHIRAVKDHDSLVDAAHMAQLVFDFISLSYQTDPRNPDYTEPVQASDVPSASPS